MKTVIQLIIVIAVVGGTGFPAHGRVQPQMLCWSPDVEFPVLCEEEESDEYGHRALPVAWPKISAKSAAIVNQALCASSVSS